MKILLLLMIIIVIVLESVISLVTSKYHITNSRNSIKKYLQEDYHHNHNHNHDSSLLMQSNVSIDNNNNNNNNNVKFDYILAFAIIPLLSLVIPSLLQLVLDQSIPINERQIELLSLLIYKRIYLYMIAIVSVIIAAKRSLLLPNELGKRLSIINTEAIGINIDDISISDTNTTTTTNNNNNNNMLANLARLERESNKEVYESLDNIKDSTQALLLPGIISLSLLVSFVFLGFININNAENTNTIINSDIIGIIKNSISSIVSIANIIVCIVFSNIEIKSAINQFFNNNNNKDKDIITESPYFSLSLSLLLSMVAVLSGAGSSLWPLQNIINMCISITVARALQFSRLPIIILALTGLVLYDFISVIGTQQLTDGGASIMEAVARSKFEASSSVSSSLSPLSSTTTTTTPSLLPWQPGLFEIVINNKVSDVLGLADIVFPSILSGWAIRWDKDNNNDNNNNNNSMSLFTTSIVGYGLGCFLCEIFQTGSGQPALVYIVPSMLSLIILKGILNKNIISMWQYESK